MASRHQTQAIGQSVGHVAAQTRDAMSEAVEHGKQQAGEVYEKAKDRAGEAYESAKERAGEMYEQASEKMGDWRDRGVHQIHVVRATVRRNALTSTLIAFGLGFILARLFFRKA
jgi:ElaB/YqjD/DUF883 family membrane-anchored ribosome-binding protein